MLIYIGLASDLFCLWDRISPEMRSEIARSAAEHVSQRTVIRFGCPGRLWSRLAKTENRQKSNRDVSLNSFCSYAYYLCKRWNPPNWIVFGLRGRENVRIARRHLFFLSISKESVRKIFIVYSVHRFTSIFWRQLRPCTLDLTTRLRHTCMLYLYNTLAHGFGIDKHVNKTYDNSNNEHIIVVLFFDHAGKFRTSGLVEFRR